MKVTVFKRKGTKETIVREDMNTIVDAISGGKYVNEVHRLRQYYHLMSPHWTEDGKMKTNFDMGIGATVSVPIFDNRSTRTAVNKAKLKQEQALLDLQEQQKQLYSTIEGYWLDAQTNQQKFRASLLNVASEQTSYELLSEQFRLGLKNIVELMNGKTNLLTSQQNMLQSKYMTILDLQLLRFYKGEI